MKGLTMSILICLLRLTALQAQDDPNPDELDLDEVIDINDINPFDFSEWNFADMLDEKAVMDGLNPAELARMFDIDWENLPSSLNWSIKDFRKKKKKKLQLMNNETVKWMFNFLLSEQLANYLKKAHSIYTLIADKELDDHDKFFKGMLLVSAGVRDSGPFVDFVVAIEGSYRRIEQLRALINDNRDLFSDQEYLFFMSSLSNIINEKQGYFGDFEKVASQGTLQMEDGDRLTLINRLRQVAQSTDEGLYRLSILAQQIVNQRRTESVDMEHIIELYGL